MKFLMIYFFMSGMIEAWGIGFEKIADAAGAKMAIMDVQEAFAHSADYIFDRDKEMGLLQSGRMKPYGKEI